MLIITGPNMGGKSTYAPICFNSNHGIYRSFVPADSAIIGDIDKIFTRIGASDDIANGRSILWLMVETANIMFCH